MSALTRIIQQGIRIQLATILTLLTFTIGSQQIQVPINIAVPRNSQVGGLGIARAATTIASAQVASAVWSKFPPNLVTAFKRRAISPSIMSVKNAATTIQKTSPQFPQKAQSTIMGDAKILEQVIAFGSILSNFNYIPPCLILTLQTHSLFVGFFFVYHKSLNKSRLKMFFRRRCSIAPRGYNKKTSLGLIFLLVDYDEKTWNTFIDIVLKWEPTLREIYCR